MAFLIHLIISTFNFGERVGHVLTGKIEQEGGSSVIAVCAFEVVYQEIPADNGFLLGREVGDDVHFFFVLKVLVGFFLPDTEYPEVFPAERRQQEEIYHLFLVLREFAFRRINVQNLFLSVCNGFLDGYFLVTFVLLFQFFHRGELFFGSHVRIGGSTCHVTQRNFFLPDADIKREFARIDSFMN